MPLILHAGAVPATYDQLRTLKMPEATETHVPIPHHKLVDMLKHSLTFYGHEVTEEAYGVTEDGNRFFGVLSLKSLYSDYTDTVGMRNSHDKKFPVGVSYGSRVFVCDNLAFAGEHVIKRKHTAKALRDMMGLLTELIEPLQAQREHQYLRFENYKNTAIIDATADHAILQMYRQNVIGLHRIDEVLQAYENPPHDWGDKTAWRLFNAATFALAGKVAENPNVTKTLHQVIDGVCETVH